LRRNAASDGEQDTYRVLLPIILLRLRKTGLGTSASHFFNGQPILPVSCWLHVNAHPHAQSSYAEPGQSRIAPISIAGLQCRSRFLGRSPM
jgi:hypothetical protein